jgi:hypothetical protein
MNKNRYSYLCEYVEAIQSEDDSQDLMGIYVFGKRRWESIKKAHRVQAYVNTTKSKKGNKENRP